MKRLLIALLVSGFSLSVSASPYIDASTKKHDLDRKAFIKTELVKVCGKKASYSCETKVLDAANKKFPRRGTNEYSSENYKNLSKAAAADKLRELGKASEQAEPFASKVDGQVTKPQLEREGWWIVKNVLKVDRYKYQLVKPWVNEKGVPLKGLNPSA